MGGRMFFGCPVPWSSGAGLFGSGSLHRIDWHQARLAFGVKRETAPGPILGMNHQPALDRIQMHVLQLLDALLVTPHVEIMEAQLPEARQSLFAPIEAQRQLRGRGAPLAAQRARDALFEHLHHRGRRAARRFADQQVDVFGHDDIADQRETVALPDLAEDSRKRVPGSHRTQERQPAIATARDEMQMALSVVAF